MANCNARVKQDDRSEILALLTAKQTYDCTLFLTDPGCQSKRQVCKHWAQIKVPFRQFQTT